MNTGVCNSTRKRFGEVIYHFIYGGDETCMQECENGITKLIGSNNRKKHKRKNQESCVSITMYRTVSVSGITGPTIFILEGKKRRVISSDKLLLINGVTIGSTIIMTPTASMTEEAWENDTSNITEGLRNIDPKVKANPQYWMTELFDDFGPNTSFFEAMQIQSENKISCVKEEGDSSHCNQAYEK